jgi:phytoene synthase
MDPDQYCAERAAASGSSLYYVFRFLPAERRRAITALYALCRELDDAVDEPSDPSIAQARLAWWRGELHNLYQGVPQHPVTRALKPFVSRFDIDSGTLGEIIDGMEMDVVQTRYLDFAALKLYCRRVAGAVGVLAAKIFGHTDPRTLEYADRLGLALQLTNIIRDVGEDARKGRVYIPADDLQSYRVPVQEILHRRPSERFTALMRFEAERAERCYDEAIGLLPASDRRAQRPGLAMAAIYRALLREIKRDGFEVLNQRISLTPIRKLWLAWRAWVAAG